MSKTEFRIIVRKEDNYHRSYRSCHEVARKWALETMQRMGEGSVAEISQRRLSEDLQSLQWVVVETLGA